MQLPNGSPFGKIKNVAESVEFYQHWANYLTPINGVLSFVVWLGGAIIKGMYYITAGLEDIFYSMFGLFGMFGEIGSRDNIIGEFYYWFQIIGISLFTMLVVIQALAGMLNKPLKFKDMIKHVTFVLLVLSVLPTAMNKIGSVAESSIKDAQTLKSQADDESISKIALQPLKNNTIDLMVLNQNRWGIDNASIYPMDKNRFLKPTVEMKYKNNITDSGIPSLNLGATLGAMDTDLLDKLDKESANKDSKVLFLHYLNSSEDDLVAVSEHRINESFNALENVYLRYKVNFLAVFLQYIALIVILVSLSIKTTKSIFEIIVTIVVAPIVGFSSTQSSKKFKELLKSVTGGVTSIFLEVVVLRIMLYVMTYIGTSSLFSNLNMMSQAIAIFVTYIGCFYGAFSGINVIERFTGVSQGHSDTLQQMIGTSMVAGAMANTVGAGMSAIGGAGKMVVGGGTQFGNSIKEAFSSKDVPSDSKGGLGEKIDDVVNSADNQNTNTNAGGLNMNDDTDNNSQQNQNDTRNGDSDDYNSEEVTKNADNNATNQSSYNTDSRNLDSDNTSNYRVSTDTDLNNDNLLDTDLNNDNLLDTDINTDKTELGESNTPEASEITGVGIDEDNKMLTDSDESPVTSNLDSLENANNVKGIGDLELENGANNISMPTSDSTGVTYDVESQTLSGNNDTSGNSAKEPSNENSEPLGKQTGDNQNSQGIGLNDSNKDEHNHNREQTSGSYSSSNFTGDNMKEKESSSIHDSSQINKADYSLNYQTKFNEKSTSDGLTSFQQARMDLKQSQQKLKMGGQQVINSSHRSTLNAQHFEDEDE